MCCLNVYEVKYNHTATTCHQAVVITAADDGGANGKSLRWENVSPSDQVTVHVYTSALQGHLCLPKTNYIQAMCYLFRFCPLTACLYSVQFCHV